MSKRFFKIRDIYKIRRENAGDSFTFARLLAGIACKEKRCDKGKG
jgi:hypothetical protein